MSLESAAGYRGQRRCASLSLSAKFSALGGREHDIDVLLFWGIFSNFDILGNHDGSVRNVGQRVISGH
jgi:hypothetical protein